MSGNKVLLIEDDDSIAELVNLHLRDLNLQVTRCADGLDGLEQACAANFDLIILDVMLPRLDGFEICKRLRQQQQRTPILMLTSRSEEFDKVLGLELGADDYLTKPFSIRELVARVRAILRRMEAAEAPDSSAHQVIQRGGLMLDTEKRKVTLAGQTVELTSKEFDLLALFVRHPGKAFSRHDLLVRVWGYQFDGYDHTVNSHINRLRAKVEPDPANPFYVRTVWGYGYRFADVDELAL